jgi:hypothetical protein
MPDDFALQWNDNSIMESTNLKIDTFDSELPGTEQAASANDYNDNDYNVPPGFD